MSEVSNEKIAALQNIILEQASDQRSALASDAKKEAEAWLAKESEKLEREVALVLADAKARAEEIHRRQLLSAEREKSTEALRQQNRLLQQAMKKFQDEMVRLRDRADYADVLAGLATTAARGLADATPVKLRLAAIDAGLGERVCKAVSAKVPDAGMTFDPDPAPIIGGCWVVSADGRRQVNADWQARTQEVGDLLADRLLSLL